MKTSGLGDNTTLRCTVIRLRKGDILTDIQDVLNENIGSVFTAHRPGLQKGKTALHNCQKEHIVIIYYAAMRKSQ